jgi:hypothetical protein
MKKKLKARNVIKALVIPGPSPQKAVIIPRGIKYKRATRVVSSTSRKAKNIAVMDAIKITERKYRPKRERKEELRIFVEFIIPFGMHVC